jgi:hypothetical protein
MGDRRQPIRDRPTGVRHVLSVERGFLWFDCFVHGFDHFIHAGVRQGVTRCSAPLEIVRVVSAADSTFISNESDRPNDERHPSAREREVLGAERNSLSPRRNDLETACNRLRLERNDLHLE